MARTRCVGQRSTARLSVPASDVTTVRGRDDARADGVPVARTRCVRQRSTARLSVPASDVTTVRGRDDARPDGAPMARTRFVEQRSTARVSVSAGPGRSAVGGAVDARGCRPQVRRGAGPGGGDPTPSPVGDRGGQVRPSDAGRGPGRSAVGGAADRVRSVRSPRRGQAAGPRVVAACAGAAGSGRGAVPGRGRPAARRSCRPRGVPSAGLAAGRLGVVGWPGVVGAGGPVWLGQAAATPGATGASQCWQRCRPRGVLSAGLAGPGALGWPGVVGARGPVWRVRPRRRRVRPGRPGAGGGVGRAGCRPQHLAPSACGQGWAGSARECAVPGPGSSVATPGAACVGPGSPAEGPGDESGGPEGR